MCLAVPGKITDKKDYLATVDVAGVQRQISLLMLPDCEIGDYVLIHAGFAIEKIDQAQAEETIALFRELNRYAQSESR